MAGVRGEKLLTASDLAALCEVDLKTIHNWVDQERIRPPPQPNGSTTRYLNTGNLGYTQGF